MFTEIRILRSRRIPGNGIENNLSRIVNYTNLSNVVSPLSDRYITENTFGIINNFNYEQMVLTNEMK